MNGIKYPSTPEWAKISEPSPSVDIRSKAREYHQKKLQRDIPTIWPTTDPSLYDIHASKRREEEYEPPLMVSIPFTKSSIRFSFLGTGSSLFYLFLIVFLILPGLLLYIIKPKFIQDKEGKVDSTKLVMWSCVFSAMVVAVLICFSSSSY